MKRSYCLIVPVLFVLVSAPLLRADEEKDKAKPKLDGSWVAEADGQEVKLTFEKGKFTAIPPNGNTVKGTYKVDTSKEPNEMDMMITEGEPRVVDKTALCIFELKGDMLKWCANDPVQGNARAKEFPEKQGPGGNYIYLIFKRVKE